MDDEIPTEPAHPAGPSISITDEMRTSYLDYAMSVIVSRAIPDLRDGLKPVHRRIIYSMYEKGLSPDKPYRKSAKSVGDVMGSYHPHGDSAIYDALARMTQDFSMSLPLIDGQGNFGSVDGDNPAAMRYTEARLARPAMSLLADIDKETVDFQDNYDGKEREPTVLPARFPNMLVNGAGGIAVGMATNIPPHNLGEVVDATLALIDNPDLSTEALIDYIRQKTDPIDPPKPWKGTGNFLIRDFLRRNPPLAGQVTIHPAHYFVPVHYRGWAYDGPDEPFARQFWGTTRSGYADAVSAEEKERRRADMLEGLMSWLTAEERAAFASPGPT